MSVTHLEEQNGDEDWVILHSESAFKNTKTQHYPYNISTLEFLSNKTIFLLQYFHNLYDLYNLYNNLGKKFYKRGIFENVDSFLKQIEKGADTLTQEDLDEEENDIEKRKDQSEEIEIQNISNRLEIEINQIENW
ncbi:hypothetical protein Glove_43g41 [Diversispora epigaea]|uniref:Uncharacterized protein n=1 Tax=Diversispora epigaea TaxID=1348612 RepID=A0A397JHY8_9GLOM|nr:hypothetical protein Glove_43g41 [Diversispora epigaea]